MGIGESAHVPITSWSSPSVSLVARIVDPDDVEVVDSRTESRLFRVGPGVGVCRILYPTGPNPGEYEDAELGADE